MQTQANSFETSNSNWNPIRRLKRPTAHCGKSEMKLVSMVDESTKTTRKIVRKTQNIQNLEFTYNPQRPNWEWINGKYNIAFTGKMKDEAGLRNYILGKFEALNTMQLITLLRGERYSIVVGDDVRKSQS